MTLNGKTAEFDAWLDEVSDVAALTMRQYLVPVEAPGAVIFPPTYPIERDRGGYNIDRFEKDGTSVCQIDSVGSQANRMEPIFKEGRYRHLVPQVTIKAGERQIHLLDAGHRAADAIVRFSTLGPQLQEAFRVYAETGNVEPLARLAPTSIVFGAWDSRATQAKLSRIVRSVIRAYNVKELTRSAQYSTIAGEIMTDGEVEVTEKGPKAELGLAHVPATKTHGGVIVEGDIRRDVIVNLTTIRSLMGEDAESTQALRKYILGLSLVSATAPQNPNLRQGCELVNDMDRPAQWTLVRYDGQREPVSIEHEQALAYAEACAETFGVAADPIEGEFNSRIANKFLTLKDEERTKLLKQGPMSPEVRNQLER